MRSSVVSSMGDPYGSNLWDDDLAVPQTGWTYNGDGTWTGVSINNTHFSINNLVGTNDTAQVVFEIISRTAGNVRAKVMGVNSTTSRTAPGIYTEIVEGGSFAANGLVGQSSFTGVVRVISFKKKG